MLERNPDYWQPDEPYLDQLEFRPLPDTESRYASIQNGDVDLIFAAYNQELVRAFQDPALSVYYGPGNAGEYEGAERVRCWPPPRAPATKRSGRGQSSRWSCR